MYLSGNFNIKRGNDSTVVLILVTFWFNLNGCFIPLFLDNFHLDLKFPLSTVLHGIPFGNCPLVIVCSYNWNSHLSHGIFAVHAVFVQNFQNKMTRRWRRSSLFYYTRIRNDVSKVFVKFGIDRFGFAPRLIETIGAVSFTSCTASAVVEVNADKWIRRGPVSNRQVATL